MTGKYNKYEGRLITKHKVEKFLSINWNLNYIKIKITKYLTSFEVIPSML